jgi:hypothetical protein
MEKNNPEVAVTLSLADYKRVGAMFDVPLYAVNMLPKLLGD